MLLAFYVPGKEIQIDPKPKNWTAHQAGSPTEPASSQQLLLHMSQDAFCPLLPLNLTHSINFRRSDLCDKLVLTADEDLRMC